MDQRYRRALETGVCHSLLSRDAPVLRATSRTAPQCVSPPKIDAIRPTTQQYIPPGTIWIGQRNRAALSRSRVNEGRSSGQVSRDYAVNIEPIYPAPPQAQFTQSGVVQGMRALSISGQSPSVSLLGSGAGRLSNSAFGPPPADSISGSNFNGGSQSSSQSNLSNAGTQFAAPASRDPRSSFLANFGGRTESRHDAEMDFR
eukprot:51067_1